MNAKYSILSGLALLLLPVAITGCRTDDAAENGSCAVDAAALVDCSVKKLVGDPVAAADAGLKGYLCSGSARPDGEPHYVDGAPQGLVCDDKGDIAGSGHGYCCNDTVARCAYNPVAECPDETYSGYQCNGIRPDFLNPLVYCREGVADGEFTSFCCRDKDLPKPSDPGWCQPKGTTCPSGLSTWQCPENDRPVSEEIPQNGSRSDFYAPICSAMGPLANSVITYCCFTPKLPPVGASCEGRQDVPNCGYGRFGFACFGTDKPSDYHTAMLCNEAGFSGTSDGGYPATLYCCDYDLTPAAATVTTP